MTGPDHWKIAERLLEHAGGMLEANAAGEDVGMLVGRQAAIAATANGHALLAIAAIGLSAHPDLLDTEAWRKAAATRAASTRG